MVLFSVQLVFDVIMSFKPVVIDGILFRETRQFEYLVQLRTIIADVHFTTCMHTRTSSP